MQNNNCDCSKFVSYKRSCSKDIHGLQFEKGKLHKFISYNNFSKKITNITNKGWIQYKMSPNIINQSFCGSYKKLTKDTVIKINHPGYKTYFPYNHWGYTFKVFIKKQTDPVYIYRIPDEVYFDNNELHPDWGYVELVATYIPQKIFIGKSEKSIKNTHLYLYGKEYDGNSILLQMNVNTYIFIGSNIFQFTTKDKIIKFISMASPSSDNTFPYAIDKSNNYYLPMQNEYINKSDITSTDIMDLYFLVSNKFKRIDNIEIIYDK